MAETDAKKYEWRAKLPIYGRFAAAALLVAAVLAIVVGFYQRRNSTGFRLKPEHTQLSKDVIAEVSNYERVESDGNVKKYYVKADHAKTFSDNHQELDNVYIEVYGDNGAVDRLAGQQGLYVPDADRNFTAYLKGDVSIDTRDALKIRTDNIVYTKKTSTADAEDRVEFERDNIKGNAVGAKVLIDEKRLDLLHDVNVEMAGDAQSASFSGNSASYDQAGNKVEVDGEINGRLAASDGSRKTDLKCDRLIAALLPARDGDKPTLRTVELFDNVWIQNRQNGGGPSTIETAYAFYDRPADRFELKNGVHIVAGEGDVTDARADQATYLQKAGDLQLIGNAEVSKAAAYLKGDKLHATLNAAKHVKSADINGSAYLKNTASERVTEITAGEMTAEFDDAQQVRNASATGGAKAVITPTDAAQYTAMTLTAPGSMKAVFRAGSPSQMTADGRATVQLNAPNNASDSANKRVTADTVNVDFNDNGKDLRHAEAIGNAELYIEPLKALPQNYRTTVYAPRFDCSFYPSGNNARECVGATKTKTVREPTVAAQGRGAQTLLADKLTAAFSESSSDVQTLQADGDAKFSESDRNAVATSMTFTQADQTVRLRGGEPTFWDSSYRAKASEIDWNVRDQRSSLRGGVSTTYYSRKKAGDAAPFGASDKPVFATADSLDVDQAAQTATYSGNARSWQDKNYVRADRFTIDQQNGTFNAQGSVQSLLYDAHQKRRSGTENVPVYASADSLAYSRNSHVLQYRNSVDIRQGTDRLTSQVANIYLDDQNQMVKTVVETGVVITQPGRRAAGDWAEYTAENEVAVIRGDPARVEDSENGSSQSGQITVYLRENKMTSEGPTKQNSSARTRSVYKVKNIQ
jgi:LPS export ABC transporter protein LptC